MYDLLAQIILAGRRNDTEGWTNILFVVVLAIFWAVGGIIKAKSRKSDTPDDKQMPRRPAHRPPEHINPLREQLLKQSRQPLGTAQRREYRPVTKKPLTKFADIRAAVRKFASEAEHAFQAQAGKTTPETKIPVPKPEIMSDVLNKVPESSRKSGIRLEDKLAVVRAEKPEAEYLSEIVLDYDDPEELRRAILHYEILGKPLSMRDTSEDVIGF